MKWNVRSNKAVPENNDAEKAISEHEETGSRDSSQITTGKPDLEPYATNTTTADSDIEKVEQHRTISKVPGNPNYFEKDGLRTYGDGQDHDTEQPLNFKLFMIFVAMAFLWCGSQIPLYMFGGIIPLIIADIGGSDRYVWIVLGYLIPLACITPFVGALSDLFGRRNLAIAFSVVLMVGNIVCATAQTMNVFIGGEVLSGIGAGVLEMTALAATGELAPTKKRGIYVGSVIISILPYSPSVVYAQLVSEASWRYVGVWLAVWSAIGGVLIAVFYFPPPRVNSSGLTRKEILRRIDYVGGFLSTAGLTLFLAGLTWGGNQYHWISAHVLIPLILGIVLCIACIIWEWKFVKYPMFPGRLKNHGRPFIVVLIITFVSGANFLSVLIFWPEQYFFMYAENDPVSVGVGSLPVGFCIIGGSIIVSILITIMKGRVRAMMIISCIIMTAGTGAMAAATLDNLKYMYIAISFACLGVGAVIIPNQIIATIVTPDDLIATATAATISARIIGGAIGFAIYYNILRQRYQTYVGPPLALYLISKVNYTFTYEEVYDIGYAISANLRNQIIDFPMIETQAQSDRIWRIGQEAFAKAFPDMYYAAIAFGVLSCIAACFLPDLAPFMDGHVAVVLQNH